MKDHRSNLDEERKEKEKKEQCERMKQFRQNLDEEKKRWTKKKKCRK